MAVRGAEEAYITLLLSDNYLPGALVLAHSLRDAGTTRKLAVMVTLDTVAANVITQLKTVYDYVISVPRIRNERPANLYLMNRPDLHSAFTKVNLWKQTQFRKLVYIDADVVAYRAPDELFALEQPFSAAPDIGWPDLFNTGVMVLSPNMGDYYAMMAMAERGISFDGADQGLINMHFRNTYNRISFTYNVTPSAHYQYVPAYRHFQSSINMVHFIGSEKPWIQGRNSTAGGGAFDEMVGRWWAVYDKHYRAPAVPGPGDQPPPEIVQYFVRGEYQPRLTYAWPIVEQPQISLQPPSPVQQRQQQSQEEQQQQQQYIHDNGQHSLSNYRTEHSLGLSHEHLVYHTHGGEHQDRGSNEHNYEIPSHEHHQHHQHHHVPGQSPGSSHVPQVEERCASPCFFSVASSPPRHGANAPQDQEHPQQPAPQQAYESKPEKPQPPPMEPSWDAQRQPPPLESKPEAINFPRMHYEMSSDTAPFVPPQRYPTPPRDMYYQVPQQTPAPPEQAPRPIFPWESTRPQASRVFVNDAVRPDESEDSAPAVESHGIQEQVELTPEEPRTIPTTPPIQQTSNPWESFSLSNAWDDVPGINRYVGAIQNSQRRQSLGTSAGLEAGNGRRESTKLTDFPVDRPSLPVTPAPMRRSNFWGGGGADPADGEGAGGTEGGNRQLFPAAEGVPGQSDWDPVAQLQKLARQQSELLLQKLGDGPITEDGDSGNGDGVGMAESQSGLLLDRGVPDLPAGSPTYIMHTSMPTVHSPKPVRKSPVQTILGEDSAVPRTTQEDSQLTTISATSDDGARDMEQLDVLGA